jgi:hypothetical protein
VYTYITSGTHKAVLRICNSSTLYVQESTHAILIKMNQLQVTADIRNLCRLSFYCVAALVRQCFHYNATATLEDTKSRVPFLLSVLAYSTYLIYGSMVALLLKVTCHDKQAYGLP